MGTGTVVPLDAFGLLLQPWEDAAPEIELSYSTPFNKPLITETQTFCQHVVTERCQLLLVCVRYDSWSKNPSKQDFFLSNLD